MAALIGKLTGSRGTASRLGTVNSGITATLETWKGSVTVELQADGSFVVRIGPKSSYGTQVVSGNVDDGKRTVVLDDNYEGLNGSLKPTDAIVCDNCANGILLKACHLKP